MFYTSRLPGCLRVISVKFTQNIENSQYNVE